MANWQFWGANPENAQIFNQAMSEITALLEPAVLNACDLSGVKKVVDVGGGKGTLMASILRAHPNARGVVLDLSHVVEQGGSSSTIKGLDERCELAAGDFFEDVPTGGDAYILKWVIHDWDDDRSVAILQNCHRAMSPGGKVIVVEAVIPLAMTNSLRGGWLPVEPPYPDANRDRRARRRAAPQVMTRSHVANRIANLFKQ